MTNFFQNKLAKIPQKLIDNVYRFSLYLFAITVLISITVCEAALILLFITAFIDTLKNKAKSALYLKNMKNNPLLLIFVVYIIAYITSSIGGINPSKSFSYLDSELIKIFSCLLLFLAIKKDISEKISNYYLAGAVIAGIIGIWQFAGSYFSTGDILRAHGKMNAVSYAETMSIALILACVKLVNSAINPKLKIIYGLSCILIGLGFVLGLSRGPTLGLLISCAMLFFFLPKIRKPFIIGFIFLISGSSFLYYNSPVFRTKISSVPQGIIQIINPQSPQKQKMDTTSIGRITMWKAGIKMIKDYPLFGTGPYNVDKIFHHYHAPVDGRSDWPDVHNIYIQKTIELGIAGGLVSTCLLLSILILSINTFKSAKNTYTIWNFAGILGFLIMMLTDSSFHLPRVAFSIYLMLAIAYAQAYGAVAEDSPKNNAV
ncbi:MAG: O-antigen ligase family protein [Elusimicrobia bacterium]|nr:O-antigen ligase family protein [Elusimicrobiota bacterium]